MGKRVSKIARGRFAKTLVMRCVKEKTVGGLTKLSLTKNKRGKIVSKRAAANGKRNYQHVGLGGQLGESTQGARDAGLCSHQWQECCGESIVCEGQGIKHHPLNCNLCGRCFGMQRR